MLQRTVTKHERRARLWPWHPRTTLIAAAALALVVGYSLLPEPPPRLRTGTRTDQELIALASYLVPSRPPQHDAEASRRRLGHALFHDRGLSGDGRRSCADCHLASRAMSDGLSHRLGHIQRSTPPLVNLRYAASLGWDGAYDDTAEFALAAIQAPEMLGMPAASAVRRALEAHSQAWSDSYGPADTRLLALPAEASPPLRRVRLPLDVLAYALASLGHYPSMRELISAAGQQHRAPSVELAARAAPADPYPQWRAAYAALSENERQALDLAWQQLGQALAAYVLSLSSGESAFDRWAARAQRLEAGQPVARSFSTDFGQQEWQGWKLFADSLACINCHSGPRLAGDTYHNLGLPLGDNKGIDLGRTLGASLAASRQHEYCHASHDRPSLLPHDIADNYCHSRHLTPGSPELVGAFRVPSLRHVAQTSPYMHDGRLKTLDDVLDFYSEPFGKAEIGRRDGDLKGLHLSREEKTALKAWLNSLSAPVMAGELDLASSPLEQQDPASRQQ